MKRGKSEKNSSTQGAGENVKKVRRWKSWRAKLNQRQHGPSSHNVENSTTAVAATSLTATATATATRVSCHIVWGSQARTPARQPVRPSVCPPVRPYVFLSENIEYALQDREPKSKTKTALPHVSGPGSGHMGIRTTHRMCNTCCCCMLLLLFWLLVLAVLLSDFGRLDWLKMLELATSWPVRTFVLP